MIHKKENIDMLKKALEKWGLDIQIDLVFEEIGELLQTLACHRRHKFSRLDLAEEICDVYIMLKQMEIAFDLEGFVKEAIEIKLERLKERLKK